MLDIGETLSLAGTGPYINTDTDINTDADIVDTLVLSRLYHPNMMEIDKRRNIPRMPLQLYGRHSLEAYGYRLGEYKGELYSPSL